MEVLMLLVPMAVYGTYHHLSFVYYIYVLIILTLLPVIPIFITSLIVSIIMRVSPFRPSSVAWPSTMVCAMTTVAGTVRWNPSSARINVSIPLLQALAR